MESRIYGFGPNAHLISVFLRVFFFQLRRKYFFRLPSLPAPSPFHNFFRASAGEREHRNWVNCIGSELAHINKNFIYQH